MLNFQDIIYFKCQILRKYKGGQNTKIGENSRSSCWAGAPLQRISPIIDNVSLSDSLEEQHLSPHLQKEVVKNVVKSLIMLKGSQSTEPAREVGYYLLPNFHKLIFSKK
jgi:hypothetical protein